MRLEHYMVKIGVSEFYRGSTAIKPKSISVGFRARLEYQQIATNCATEVHLHFMSQLHNKIISKQGRLEVPI